MVTHRLPEVRRYCDEMLVLRDGVTVARFDRESFDERAVVHAMVGEARQTRSDDDVAPPLAAHKREDSISMSSAGTSCRM